MATREEGHRQARNGRAGASLDREMPEARTSDEIRNDPYDLIELRDHLQEMLDRHNAEDPPPNVLRAEFVEVLSQYPVDMAADRETRQFRKRMEAYLSDDDAFGGPSPDYLKRVRTRDDARETVGERAVHAVVEGIWGVACGWVAIAVIVFILAYLVVVSGVIYVLFS